MHSGRQAKAADFAGKLAAAAKKKHERVETRTELPADLAETLVDLASSVLSLRQEMNQIKADLGVFYTRLGEKAA